MQTANATNPRPSLTPKDINTDQVEELVARASTTPPSTFPHSNPYPSTPPIPMLNTFTNSDVPFLLEK